MDIAAWLEGLGLGAHVESFRANRIDADVLCRLTAEDLKELGVTALGDRKRLLAAIEAQRGAEPAAARPPPAPGAAAEYRQVTLLFADIAGFTGLAERLGAEATHALLNRYFEVADRLIEQSGGTIDKHIGDSVMAVFGAPVAHDNDPERAVRVALELQEAAGGIVTPEGPLRLHIGIATGQVVASGTGSDLHSTYTVTGSAVNIAARLQALAEAGETLVTGEVLSALPGRVEATAAGEHRLKGVAQPVPVWRVTGFRDGPTAQPLPFTGRTAELGQCRALLAEILATARGRMVVIRGPAGIGKTRLIGEVASYAWTEGFAVHRALVLDFGSRRGQDPVSSLVRSLLGLPAESGEGVRRAAVAALIADGVLSPAERVFAHDLLDLAGDAESDRIAGALDGAARSAGRRRLFLSLVARAAGAAPCLLIVEDVHWADARTLDMLAAVAASTGDLPVLLLCSTRPEGDPLEGAWRSLALDHPVSIIGLGPLRTDEARKLAAAFEGLDADLRALCLERASGNPLFLDQLLRAASESGLSTIPGSIRSLVLARLDRLPAEDRRALQAASALGQRFGLAPLRALIGSPAYEAGELVRQQLVRPDGDGFLFAHALIREGVYDSIVGTARRQLHGAAARWFAAADPMLEAEHLRLAGDPAAAAAYLAAARAERAAYRHESAASLLAKGLELATGGEERHVIALELGETRLDGASAAAAHEAFSQALSVAPDTPGRVRALIGIAAAKRISDDRIGALAALDEAEALAGDLDMTAERARASILRGNLLFPTGDIEGCLGAHTAGLSLARAAGSAELEAAALGGLADVEYLRGRPRTARDRFADCVAVGRARGLGRVVVANLPMLAIVTLMCGELAEARRIALEAVAAAAEVANARAEMIARHAAFLCERFGGVPDAARLHVERSVELARLLGTKRFEAEGVIFRAELEFWTGDRDRALADGRRAIALARESGLAYFGPTVLGGLALVVDDAAERAAAIAEAEALLAGPSPEHNQFFFRLYATDAFLCRGEWDEAERHAAALWQRAGQGELPLAELLSRRGILLSRLGRGETGAALLAEAAAVLSRISDAGLRAYADDLGLLPRALGAG